MRRIAQELFYTNICFGSWVLQVPTWPIEWQQMSALLAYQDFMETGAPDLFRTYENRLYNRTNIGAVDGTGLVNTSKGRHIVVSVVCYDWRELFTCTTPPYTCI